MTDVRPPVEPMSDLSWARVERGLWARLDGTQPTIVIERRRWPWIVVPSVAVAAAAAAAFALLIDTPNAPVSAPAPLAHAPVDAEAGRAHDALDNVPLRVVSGESPSTITHGDAHVALDADSAVVMPHDSAVLERGSAWFAVPQRARPFVVVAGDAVIRVVDTKFRVARFAEHATIEVERGTVDVTFQGTSTRLSAGESWSSQPARPVEVERPVTVKKAKPVAVADDERAKFERMAALEASDPRAAITGYLELARGTSRWAELSLFAAARLSADRGESRATLLLDMYLRRFPRGANADDARQLSDRLKGAP